MSTLNSADVDSMSSLSHWMTVRSSIVAFSIGTSVIRRARGRGGSRPDGWRGGVGKSRTVVGELDDQVLLAPWRSGSSPACKLSSASDPPRSGTGVWRADRALVSGKARDALPTSRTAERASVANHVGDHGGAVAAVLLVDRAEGPLRGGRVRRPGRHPEVRVRSFERKRSKRQVHSHRIDRGDAEAVADRGVRRRAAALAEDALHGPAEAGRSPTSSGSSRG